MPQLYFTRGKAQCLTELFGTGSTGELAYTSFLASSATRCTRPTAGQAPQNSAKVLFNHWPRLILPSSISSSPSCPSFSASALPSLQQSHSHASFAFSKSLLRLEAIPQAFPAP